jgi:hypothetical protein
VKTVEEDEFVVAIRLTRAVAKIKVEEVEEDVKACGSGETSRPRRKTDLISPQLGAI